MLKNIAFITNLLLFYFLKFSSVDYVYYNVVHSKVNCIHCAANYFLVQNIDIFSSEVETTNQSEQKVV
jgi:hypothetical protein